LITNNDTSQPLKILIIAARFHTNLYYRAKALQDAGHQVKVLALYEGKSEFTKGTDIEKLDLSLFSKIILKILSFFKKTPLKSGAELRLMAPNRRLRQILRSYKPDVILLKAYQNLLALKTLIVNKRAKVLMLTQTDKTHIKGSKFLFKLNIRLFKKLGVHAYLTPIKSNYDAFKKFGINNVYYSPFVYPQQDKKQKTNSNSQIRIISVGKYVKRKDQKTLIKACENLINTENLTIDFYGEKADKLYYKELQKLIEEKKLAKNINLYTNINYEVLQKIYGNYDIFVLPSYAEPAAYSIVEAMANGLPVICSDECGTQCYIEEGKNGCVFKAKNAESLTQKIEQLIKPGFLKKASENALSAAENKHAPELFVRDILKAIK
jgi:glycosyltransferase involved in cell wall biosynthesis